MSPRSDLRRARGERRFRQNRRSACLFKARRRNDPERLPPIRPAALRPRWAPLRLGVQSSFKVPRTLFACSRVTGRRPTTPAPGSHYPSISRPPARRLRAVRRVPASCGRDALHRLLQPIHFYRAPVRIARCLRWRLACANHHAFRGKPRQATQVVERLTALYELWRLPASRSTGSAPLSRDEAGVAGTARS